MVNRYCVKSIISIYFKCTKEREKLCSRFIEEPRTLIDDFSLHKFKQNAYANTIHTMAFLLHAILKTFSKELTNFITIYTFFNTSKF